MDVEVVSAQKQFPDGLAQASAARVAACCHRVAPIAKPLAEQSHLSRFSGTVTAVDREEHAASRSSVDCAMDLPVGPLLYATSGSRRRECPGVRRGNGRSPLDSVVCVQGPRPLWPADRRSASVRPARSPRPDRRTRGSTRKSRSNPKPSQRSPACHRRSASPVESCARPPRPHFGQPTD